MAGALWLFPLLLLKERRRMAYFLCLFGVNSFGLYDFKHTCRSEKSIKHEKAQTFNRLDLDGLVFICYSCSGYHFILKMITAVILYMQNVYVVFL